MTIVYILLVVLIAVFLWLIGTYNHFVALVNRSKEAWSDIEVQLKRRYDLIPNLVNTVKGYATHESSAFENVTKARAMAMGAGSLEDKSKAEIGLTGALKSLFAVADGPGHARRIPRDGVRSRGDACASSGRADRGCSNQAAPRRARPAATIRRGL
jgi:hypothetical protein